MSDSSQWPGPTGVAVVGTTAARWPGGRGRAGRGQGPSQMQGKGSSCYSGYVSSCRCSAAAAAHEDVWKSSFQISLRAKPGLAASGHGESNHRPPFLIEHDMMNLKLSLEPDIHRLQAPGLQADRALPPEPTQQSGTT